MNIAETSIRHRTTVLVLLPISANGHETVTQLPRIKQVIESQRAARRA